MAPTTLPKIFRANLGTVLQALEQYEVQGFSSKRADELFELCEVVLVLVRWSWARIQADLQEGIEGRELSTILRTVCDSLEETLRVYARLRNVMAAGPPDYAKLSTNLSKLEQAMREVDQVRQRMSSLLAWADAPLPPIEASKLVRGEATPSSEGYENGDQILARIQSGGDL
jgi:hypothetical protein